MPRRTVAVFTSTRADAGVLESVAAAVDADDRIDLVMIRSGTRVGRWHRTPFVREEPGKIVTIDVGLESDDPSALVSAIAKLGPAVGSALVEQRVDVLLVIGDRWELMAVVPTAVLHQVAIGHIHGGEVTEGAIDERIRHAVTKLADLHFCSTAEAQARLLQMGEERWRVHLTGAPGLDRFVDVAPLPADELSDLVGGPVRHPIGIVTYHPTTVNRGRIAERARHVFDAAGRELGTVILTFPGWDPGAAIIAEEIRSAQARHDNLRVVRNLGTRYPAVLASVDVMVGNSSSGIIEAMSFALPVVDVGDRQAGRTHGENVIHAEEDHDDIARAIRRCLKPSFRRRLEGLPNPYGDGRAGRRIADAIAEVPLDRLPRKRFVDAGAMVAGQRGTGRQ